MKKNLLFLQSRIKPNLGYKLVTPADIIEGEFKAIGVKDTQGFNLIPYCIDFKSNVLIHSVGVDPVEASKATFQYDYIRKNAQYFLYTPLESLAKSPPNINISAVLLFSPGRCGSTLLSKLIAEIGVPSISEPDIYSQAALYFAPKDKSHAKADQVRHLLRWANFFQLSPFLKMGAPNVLIKLRSHVNNGPGIVLSSFTGPHKTIFLKRDFHSWCMSRMRAFGNTIESNLDIYTRSLHCLRFLLKNSDCLVLDYEDLNKKPEAVLHKLSVFFGTPINMDQVKEVLGRDSQADTNLARDKVKKALSAAEMEAIDKIWRQHAPHDLLKELDLA
ncbi:sulfotransferase domain-containing protein [Candidatus Methylopumilus turicensis]|uniref:Uncharacterized protein n=1 Tax=Candidatus Methylopumilus turicensis TaxID=1581680 RepID=A0A0B7J0Q1_9PROT|nr:sulfotransferase domain-containing protein [Candidatus Methylopumilus turicensis]CEN56203.1 protein of unknown function [Candidatus Methylopumilus turicensis]